MSLVGKTVVAKYNAGYGGIVMHVAETNGDHLLLLADLTTGDLFTEWASVMRLAEPPVTVEQSDGVPTEEVPFR